MRDYMNWAAPAAMALASVASAAPIEDAGVTRTAPDRVTVAWRSAAPVDVYVSDRADATIRTARLVARADADGRVDVPDAGPARSYFLLRDTRSGATLRTAERLLPLERGSNFRDIGGYAAAGGKHVRWGLIYRSGATPLLTDADVARVHALGLRDMIDLRSSEERVLAPTRITGVRYTAIDYPMMTMMGDRPALTNGIALYHGFPAFFAPQLRIIFGDLTGGQRPILYHCSAGQDRTGFATAMILSALGVPRATILTDYHLSTADRRPENELPPIDDATARTNPVAALFQRYQHVPGASVPRPLKEADGRAFLEGAFDEIDRRWGSVDAYLAQEVGVTPALRARLRAQYLE